MWKVTVCIVTIWLLVQVNASPEISLEDLLERLVTLEDWKRETEIEVSTLRKTVEQQGELILNLEKDLAIQKHLTATLISREEDKQEETEEAKEENVYDETNAKPRQAPANRISRTTDLGKEIPKKTSAINKREIAGGVAFTVYLDHDVNLGTTQTIKFNKIITNDGDGYNIHSGVFTCPEAGVYLFSFFMGERSQSGAAGIHAELRVNSQIVVDAVVDTWHASQDLQGGNMVVIRLNLGDVVWIDAAGNYHVEGSPTNRFTTFTGVYLYA